MDSNPPRSALEDSAATSVPPGLLFSRLMNAMQVYLTNTALLHTYVLLASSSCTSHTCSVSSPGTEISHTDVSGWMTDVTKPLDWPLPLLHTYRIQHSCTSSYISVACISSLSVHDYWNPCNLYDLFCFCERCTTCVLKLSFFNLSVILHTFASDRNILISTVESLCFSLAGET